MNEAITVWIVIGFSLIIIELLTGTFYLLVLGLGALFGAILASLDASYLVQAIGVSVAAIAGSLIVNRWHKKERKSSKIEDNFLDHGQPVIFESWLDKNNNTARVKYRDASWDAKIIDEKVDDLQYGRMLFINKQIDGVFQVKSRPE